jgi:hypothetical protein
MNVAPYNFPNNHDKAPSLWGAPVFIRLMETSFLMPSRSCRNPNGADYGLYAAAEIGDRLVISLQENIAEMPPSNEKTVAGIASTLSRVAFTLAKNIINEPLCHKIDLSPSEEQLVSQTRQRMLPNQAY